MSNKDKIVVICPNNRFTTAWTQALKKHAHGFDIQVYPEDTQRESTEFVMSFSPDEDAFSHYPNLKVVASMGAGVQSILNNPSLPRQVQITKVVQPEHQEDIAEFVLALCLNHLRKLMVYTLDKLEKKWEPKTYKRAVDTTVGIMGIGAIGQVIGRKLVKNGFSVKGWSRTKKNLKNIQTFYGDAQKNEFLKGIDILVCILPLTPLTEGILNKKVFQQLNEGAFLINIGRGGQLVEEDLINALENNQLSGAALDVFRQEPLPENHVFWEHKKIMITPHIAGNTHPELAVKDVLRNYKAMKSGKKLIHTVDRERGY